MEFSSAFKSSLYDKLMERIAPRESQRTALREIGETLRAELYGKGALSTETYTRPDVRKAYVLSYFAPAIAQALDVLKNEYFGEAPCYSTYQSNLANQVGNSRPIRVSIIAAGPAPELFALVGLLDRQTKKLDVDLFDLGDHWSESIDFFFSLVEANCRGAASWFTPAKNAEISLARHDFDFSRELDDGEINSIAENRHLVYLQNAIGEMGDSKRTTVVENLVKIAKTLPLKASLILSESISHGPATRALSALQEALGAHEEIQIHAIKKSTRNPFRISDMLANDYFGRFENGTPKAKVDVKYVSWAIRKPIKSLGMNLPRTIDFDLD